MHIPCSTYSWKAPFHSPLAQGKDLATLMQMLCHWVATIPMWSLTYPSSPINSHFHPTILLLHYSSAWMIPPTWARELNSFQCTTGKREVDALPSAQTGKAAKLAHKLLCNEEILWILCCHFSCVINLFRQQQNIQNKFWCISASAQSW